MKTHVRKVNNEQSKNVALCAFNNQRGYSDLGNAVVSAKDFRKATNRCQLCEFAYLTERNRQRKAKGLPAVQTAFEGLE